MSNTLRVILGGASGALVGAVGVSSLVIAFTPNAKQSDSHTILLQALTMPLGALVGLIGGAYLASERLDGK